MEATESILSLRRPSLLQDAKKTEELAAIEGVKEVETNEQVTTDFAQIMSKLLGKTGQEEVNEEELFSRIIEKLLADESPEAGSYYKEQVQKLSVSMARGDGYVPVEDVAKAALKNTVLAGKIEESKAELIHAKAFTSAQLDATKEALYDGRGETKAVASLDEAMLKMKMVLEEIETGKVLITGRSLDAPSNRGLWQGVGSVEGAQQSEGVSEGEEGSKARKFAWKHISDKDGKLAVLVPEPLSDNIKSVDIFDSSGKLVESGRYSKRTGDGRAVYRFEEPGPEYGKNLEVVISKKNGDTITYEIPDGSKRVTEWLEGNPEDRIDKKEEKESAAA